MSAGPEIAQVPARDIDANRILAKCLSIISNPQANDVDRRFALDIAYDQGHSDGYAEALQRALAKFEIAVSKVGT